MADHFGGVVPQADVEESQTKLIYGAVITVTILATIAVILRFMARKKSAASISYEYVLSMSILPFIKTRYQAFRFFVSSRHLPRLYVTAVLTTRPRTSDYSIVIALVRAVPLTQPLSQIKGLISSSAIPLWPQSRCNT